MLSIINRCNKENDGSSCDNIGDNGICGGSKFYHSNKEKYLKKSCDFGYVWGCNKLIEYYDKIGEVKKADKQADIFEKKFTKSVIQMMEKLVIIWDFSFMVIMTIKKIKLKKS